MTRLLPRLAREKRGVTIVEFAFLSPVMLVMICGSIEMGHMLLARAVLDGAIVEAARTATASLETGEAERTEIMVESIQDAMSSFPIAEGEEVRIETRVYRDFSSVTPEYYDDANENGSYDLGEAFTDRNGNGKWDPATPISGTLGGPGDVVSFTAVYPRRTLFTFLERTAGLNTTIDLTATTVVRNESVVRRT